MIIASCRRNSSRSSSSLYAPFGSPCREQKPSGEREENAPPRRSEPLRSKVGGPKRSSPCFAGWDRLGIAVYSVNTGKELMAYTKIGSVLIDNNCCERAVRPFTNLRKNFGGFSCEQGARVTATFLTFVETCKLMAMAPLDFFRGFFDMIVAGSRDYALMTEVLLVKPV